MGRDMTDETLDKLLQEFLIHKDLSLSKSMADMLKGAAPVQIPKDVDMSGSNSEYSLVSDHPSLHMSLNQKSQIRKDDRLAPSEIIDSLTAYILSLSDSAVSVGSSGAQSTNQRVDASENKILGRPDIFSKMLIEEIAFPEPEEMSQGADDESKLTAHIIGRSCSAKEVWGWCGRFATRGCNALWFAILHTVFSEDLSTRMYFTEAKLMRSCSIPVYYRCTLTIRQIGDSLSDNERVRGTTMKEIIQELYVMPRGSTTWTVGTFDDL